MKAHQSSSSFIVILLVMAASNLSLNVRAAHQDETAATLRGNAVVGQEERILGKGGNGGGGGGGGKNKETPVPTHASTLAPTPPITPKPTPGTNSCGTRPPTTPKPATPAPTPPTAPNCISSGGTCAKNGTPCCDGYECQGKTKTCVAARRNLRVEQAAKTFPFQTRSVADARHRKLEDQCSNDPEYVDTCNENNNPLVCPPDIPSDAEELYSVICNYNESGAQFVATVDPCKSDSTFCCDDGTGGLYYPVGGCWGTNVQCCPKGYTKNLNGNGCIPLNCCDGNGDHKQLYCPNC